MYNTKIKTVRAAAFILISFSIIPSGFSLDFDRGAGGFKAALAASDTPRVSAPAPVSDRNNNKIQGVKEWTVLVYVNGKNDLERAGLYNLNKMELVGSGDKLNIVTEIGRMNGQNGDTAGDGNWTGSRRYFVTKDRNEEKIKSDRLQSFGKVDMGDWRHLVDFAKWGMANYPARHYMLIVWNHGSGWLTTKDLPVNKGISYDFETKNHISTPELGAAMREIGKVDILAYDACLMQMAELLYEVNGYADYVVGSEETVPGMGFPYDTILKSFTGSKNSGELAAEMVSAYDGFYATRNQKTTLSAVRMSALGGFMTAFNAWTEALLASDKKTDIHAKAYLAGSYAASDNKDLYDFVRLAAAVDPQGPVGEKGRALMAALSGELIINNLAYKKGRVSDTASHGLAIYLPHLRNNYNPKYDQLAWARDTRWDEYLKEMAGPTEILGCAVPAPDASYQVTLAFIACLEAANKPKP
ncbi:MAG TPA: hypothetical protein DCZ92_13760 [Elusimicrobia bacterium]|nr:hypothetical protein [Elusimicrobiota bacterium]